MYDLDKFESMLIDTKSVSSVHGGKKAPSMKVTAMPGRHVPAGVLETMDDIVGAVPPTSGWMLELSYTPSAGTGSSFTYGYWIYISGVTLLVDELKEIPKRYIWQSIDLLLLYRRGTTIHSPMMPLLIVTMDATQGLQLIRLINPVVMIPIHFDDYDVFLKPVGGFQERSQRKPG